MCCLSVFVFSPVHRVPSSLRYGAMLDSTPVLETAGGGGTEKHLELEGEKYYVVG